MSKSVYEMVTERIIDQLEQGVIPWQKPWTGVRSGAFNRISKKPYSLLNQMRSSLQAFISCCIESSLLSILSKRLFVRSSTRPISFSPFPQGNKRKNYKHR